MPASLSINTRNSAHSAASNFTPRMLFVAVAFLLPLFFSDLASESEGTTNAPLSYLQQQTNSEIEHARSVAQKADKEVQRAAKEAKRLEEAKQAEQAARQAAAKAAEEAKQADAINKAAASSNTHMPECLALPWYGAWTTPCKSPEQLKVENLEREKQRQTAEDEYIQWLLTWPSILMAFSVMVLLEATSPWVNCLWKPAAKPTEKQDAAADAAARPADFAEARKTTQTDPDDSTTTTEVVKEAQSSKQDSAKLERAQAFKQQCAEAKKAAKDAILARELANAAKSNVRSVLSHSTQKAEKGTALAGVVTSNEDRDSDSSESSDSYDSKNEEIKEVEDLVEEIGVRVLNNPTDRLCAVIFKYFLNSKHNENFAYAPTKINWTHSSEDGLEEEKALSIKKLKLLRDLTKDLGHNCKFDIKDYMDFEQIDPNWRVYMQDLDKQDLAALWVAWDMFDVFFKNMANLYKACPEITLSCLD